MLSIQMLSIVATLAAAIVAAVATVRAKRIEVESSARLKEADQVHEEAKGIWADAKSLRDELRNELQRERERGQERESALLKRIEALEQRVSALQAELDTRDAEVERLREFACDVAGCERRRRPGK